MQQTALAAALALVAMLCLAPPAARADETALALDLLALDWRVTEVDGAAPGWTATLDLGEPGKVSGQAPCNRYFGLLVWTGSSFTVGNLAATKMACLHMQGEAEFLALLQGIETAEQLPGLLILTGGGHEMRLVQPID